MDFSSSSCCLICHYKNSTIELMKWLNNLPEWILGIIGIVVFIVIVVLVGDVYRKFQSLWVCLWFSIPIMAYIISTRRLDAHLTEKGMKSLRVWLMVFAVGMSFIIFFDYDLKAKFGHYFFKGSKFWAADLGDEDDYGNPVLSHEYFAPT